LHYALAKWNGKGIPGSPTLSGRNGTILFHTMRKSQQYKDKDKNGIWFSSGNGCVHDVETPLVKIGDFRI
jgi:hypothetical protein